MVVFAEHALFIGRFHIQHYLKQVPEGPSDSKPGGNHKKAKAKPKMTIDIKEMMGPPPLKPTNDSSEQNKKPEILALVDIEEELPFSAATQNVRTQPF